MEQQTRLPTARQALWVLGIVVLLIIGGYTAEWTGFGEADFTKESVHYNDSDTTVDVAQDPRRAKTLWDWLQLLIVPAVLAIGGFWFNMQQNERAQWAEDQRAQDTALQAYLDQMSELLIDKELHEETKPHSDKRVTARARTLTVLSQLKGERPKRVLQFLYETRLISRGEELEEGGEKRKIEPRIVGLNGADLAGADLKGIKLINTSLQGVILRGADLRDADLSHADLSGAEVTEEQLAACSSLEGAIMPDGSKHD